MRSFELYEALLWEPGTGYFLLDAHLERLAGSARHLGFAFDPAAARARLEALAKGLARSARVPQKVRLELRAGGGFTLESDAAPASVPVCADLAQRPVRSDDPFLRHKTSRREVFEGALRDARIARPSLGDVVLWNEKGELTETTRANLVLEVDGRRWTPRLAAGLLPGTYRRHLLERGEIEETALGVADFEKAEAAYGVNSVRRWFRLVRP